MGRRAKSPKGKAEAKRPPARKSPKNEGAGVRDLRKRLAESPQQHVHDPLRGLDVSGGDRGG